jgi:hypothetical protein
LTRCATFYCARWFSGRTESSVTKIYRARERGFGERFGKSFIQNAFDDQTKYRDGLIPDGKIQEHNYFTPNAPESAPTSRNWFRFSTRPRRVFAAFDNYEFSLALETLWTVIARIDKMISDAKPWELVKDENQTETLNAVCIAPPKLCAGCAFCFIR